MHNASAASQMDGNKPMNLEFDFEEAQDDFFADAPLLKEQPNRQIEFANKRPLKILVVDDNEINRKVIRTILSTLGYETRQAASGEEALEALDTQPADYIFMDIDMPGMTGIETTEKIRSIEGSAQEPRKTEIVAVTANVSPSIRLQCKRAGMNGFLEKPITSNVIEAQLRRSWARIRPKKS